MVEYTQGAPLNRNEGLHSLHKAVGMVFLVLAHLRKGEWLKMQLDTVWVAVCPHFYSFNYFLGPHFSSPFIHMREMHFIDANRGMDIYLVTVLTKHAGT